MQSNSDCLFEKAKQRYPQRDPGVDALFLDISSLPLIQQRGGMNAGVYLPVFDVVLKYLRQEKMDTTMPTILLVTVQQYIEPVLASPFAPNPFQKMEIYRETLSAMYSTIDEIASYLNNGSVPLKEY